ncbi:MAG: GSU2403 family nucleotidyltransferase fold protein [Campylobacterota bacterium]|nr:GSU2403 family nucleotidyltransferase fold protein [Campylobacterota bacterium]
MFRFIEYNNEQRKAYVNAEQIYKTYLDLFHKYNKSFRYKMIWNKSGDKEYLYKYCYDTKKSESLGRRDDRTEKIIEKFKEQKKELKESLKKYKELLKKQARIGKFEKISRVPSVLANLLRAINEYGLDDKVIIIGTNALYSYEARCGVFMEDEHLATYDIDIFNKREKKISVALKTKLPQKTLRAILQDTDKSFSKSTDAPYRFFNDDGVVVEIITPMSNKESKQDEFRGVLNLEIDGIKWLRSSELYKVMVIGNNGVCANMTTIKPLEYAVYKYWLGRHERKDYMKRERDTSQSVLVTNLINKYMPNVEIKEDARQIKNISREAIEEYLNKVCKF